MSVNLSGIQLDCLVQFPNGLLKLLFAAVNCTKVHIGNAYVGLQLKGVKEQSLRRFEISTSKVHVSQVGKGPSMHRAVLQLHAELLLSLVKLPLLPIQVPKAEMNVGLVRGDTCCSSEFLDCL